ncbi:MAG: hypothetical protein OHK0037_11160 [Elainellaceae cyanobacterium]
MESLAYIHAAVAYEDPNPAPELQVSLEIPSSVWLGTLSTAVVVSAVGGVAPEAQAVVRFGDTCAQVGDVQNALASAGFSPGFADSVFGSNTLSAVRRFQLSKGLSVDGVVGPATASNLGLSGAIYNVGVSCGVGGDPGGPDFIRVTTNGSPLTVRNGPGTGFAAIDYLSNGSVVRVVGASGGWYNISGGGWISQAWTSESSGDDGDGSSGGGGNYFVDTNGGTLLVRSGPGTGYVVIDELFNGTNVTVTETSGGWGRLAGGGWVSMSWLSPGGSGGTGGGGGGGGTGTGNYFVDTNGGTLLVRNGPGTGYSWIYELSNGSSVTVVETYAGWGRLSDGGWVSMDWLSAGGSGGGGGGGGGGIGGYYVSTNGGTLIVRSGPGLGYVDIDEIANGSYIDIVEIFGGWGRLSDGGWVSMDWVAYE